MWKGGSSQNGLQLVLGLNESKPIVELHILGILLMISYWFDFYFSDTIVVCEAFKSFFYVSALVFARV